MELCDENASPFQETLKEARDIMQWDQGERDQFDAKLFVELLGKNLIFFVTKIAIATSKVIDD